jgi:hypothetical protein
LYRSHESWLQKDSFRFVIDKSGFVLYRGSRILHVYKRFVSWIRFVDWFSKDSTCFYESYESLRILSTIARNESLKIKIRESESLRIFRVRIHESWIRFVDSFLKDSFRGFVLCKQESQITRFVLICKDSYTNPASLDLVHNKTHFFCILDEFYNFISDNNLITMSTLANGTQCFLWQPMKSFLTNLNKSEFLQIS